MAVEVSVVIPTLNEARNLPLVFAELRPEWEIIVVDGRSRDGTAEVARRLRPDARILRQRGRGKGRALVQGFAAARGEYVVMMDADGSADPVEIPRFVAALRRGADFAKGSRFVGDGGSADITRIRKLGNRALGAAVNALFGTRYTDLCYGYNALRRSVIPRLRIDCAGFEVETLINIRAAEAGLRTVEVPSYESLRIHGASNLRTFRDGMRVLQTILRERRRRGSLGQPPAHLPAQEPARKLDEAA